MVDRLDLWRWVKVKPTGILITQDGDDLTEFLTNRTQAIDALNRMETAMTIA